MFDFISLEKTVGKLFSFKKDKEGKVVYTSFQKMAFNFLYDKLMSMRPVMHEKLTNMINWAFSSIKTQEKNRGGKVGIIAYFDENKNDFVCSFHDIEVNDGKVSTKESAFFETHGVKIIKNMMARINKSRDFEHLFELMQEDIFQNEAGQSYEEADYTEIGEKEIKQANIPQIKLLEIKKK